MSFEFKFLFFVCFVFKSGALSAPAPPGSPARGYRQSQTTPGILEFRSDHVPSERTPSLNDQV